MSSSRCSSASATAPIRKRWRGAERGRSIDRENDPISDALVAPQARGRKVAPAAGAAEQSRAEARPDEQLGAAPTAPAANAKPAEPAFDLSKLPPLDSITAGTDIRAFLAPGVPPELTRAALRRAWAADPKVRDLWAERLRLWFPCSGPIPGFGPLEMTDEFCARR